MTSYYLIRHGEIAQATPRRFVGSRDVPLTGEGRQQIARLADYLASRSIDRVVTSPLTRCVESGQLLCARLQLDAAEQIPALKEISLGAWEGLTVDQVRARFPGDYEARGRDLAHFRPSGGESFTDLLLRSWPAFTALEAEAAGTLAIIAHAGVNRVLLCRLLGIPLVNLLRLEQHYGCANIIHRDSQGYRVETINFLPSR